MNGAPKELLAKLLAGEPLDAAERKALWLALAVGESAEGIDQLVLDRLLKHHFNHTKREHFAAEVMARLSLRESNSTLRGQVMRRLTWQRWRLPAAAAAAIMLLGVLWLVLKSVVAEATLTAGTGVLWDREKSWEVGDSLHDGDRLRLEYGFVSLRFASGAEVLIEGDSDLEITGSNSAMLHRGSVVARVPASASGFALSGPQGKVVDLGTEFGVKADELGMEVHVLEGVVEAYPTGKPMMTLRQDSAVRMDASGAALISPTPDSFLTSLPPDRSSAPAWLHWSFDEGMGGEVAASGFGLPVEAARGKLTSLPGSVNRPSWTAGVRGSGIEFHGKDDYIATDYPGVSGAGPRTVACWVRVPQDLTTEGFALISWGAHQEFGDTWQLSINTTAVEGPVGRLRIGTHMGHVIGHHDLRDGAWHHVAAVLYPGSQPDVSTHVLLYVDGALEPAACKTVRRVNTDTAGALAQPVAFGKNSGARSATDRTRDSHTFRGSIDEVTLCTAALSEADIRLIMHKGMESLP